MVRGRTRETQPDYDADAARHRLSMVLEAARSIYRAKTFNQHDQTRGERKRRYTHGERYKQLQKVADQAHLLRVAYLKLNPASRAALSVATIDKTAPKAVLTDLDEDGDEVFLLPARSLSRNWLETFADDLAALEHSARGAMAPPPRGRAPNEGDIAVVALLAAFLDWCGSPGGGAFPSRIAISDKKGSPFHLFARAAFRAATGTRYLADQGDELLRAIEKVKARRGVHKAGNALLFGGSRGE